MTDFTKKLLVVIGGVVLIGTVVFVRSGMVVLDFLHERAEAHSRREAACEAKVERALENDSPLPNYRTPVPYRRTTPPPSSIRLATLRLPGQVAAHKRITESETLQYQCLFNAAVELGGNDYVIEGVEPDADKPDQGKLVEGVYLVAARPLPAEFAPRFPHCVSIVTDLFEASPAERAGLRPGDLPVDLDHRGLGEGSCENTDVDEAVNRLADGVSATMTVVRNGQIVEIPVWKEGGRYGYRHQAVPFLPATR